MLTLTTSFFLLFYVLIPGIFFRFVFSFFVPLRNIPRTKTEEVTFAVINSLIPFTLTLLLMSTFQVLGSHPFHFSDCPELHAADHRTVFSSLVASPTSAVDQAQLLKAIPREGMRQGRILTWFYTLLFIQAALMGWLARNYGRFSGNRFLGPIYDRFLLPTISEWHVLFTPFVFPRKPKMKVVIDALTTDDHLYKGNIGDFFVGRDGKLTGLLLRNTMRFRREEYLEDKRGGRSPSKGDYWVSIPGTIMYLPASGISTLNFGYEPEEETKQRTDFFNSVLGDTQTSVKATVVNTESQLEDGE